MKRTVLIAAMLSMAAAAPAFAAGVFDGVWVADLKHMKLPTKPDAYELRQGVFTCKTCAPPYSIPADGAFHKATGSPYADERAVKIVDAHTVKQSARRGGKLVFTSTTVVSADGKTATMTYSDSSATNAAPVTGKGTATRVAAGLAGSHALAGSWRAAHVDDASANGLTVTYKVVGDRLEMSTPTGQSYSAKLDGTEAPYKGDPGTTSVTVMKVGDRKLVETDKRNGKIIGVQNMVVAPDGKTAAITYDDKLHGTTMSMTANKR